MKIETLSILTADINATTDFYRDILQLPLIAQNDISVSFQAGYSVLNFITANDGQPTYHFAFNIPCNQIEQALDWLKEKVEIIPETDNNIIADFTNWNAKAFYFYDNNRNIVELIARFDLHNESDEYFSGTSIVSISEAGIPVNDVEQTCAELKSKYGFDYFAKQPPLKGFAAMGDDEGLFIIVDINRNWYPTQQHSAAFYISMQVIHENEKIEITYHQ